MIIVVNWINRLLITPFVALILIGFIDDEAFALLGVNVKHRKILLGYLSSVLLYFLILFLGIEIKLEFDIPKWFYVFWFGGVLVLLSLIFSFLIEIIKKEKG